MKNHILFSNRNWKHELRVEVERQNELREEAVAAERERATAAEKSLQDKFEAEKARASAADERLETNKADKDGYYQKMTSGFSNNLVGRGEGKAAQFIFRTSGSTQSIEDGVAHIESIKGNTIVWNQLARDKGSHHENEITFTSNGDGSYSLQTALDSSATVNTAFEIARANNCAGHKILICGAPATSTSTSYCLKSEDGYKETGDGVIFTSSIDSNSIFIYVSKGTIINSTTKFKPQVFDLTRMFGPGNEPATIAEFRKLFPEEYYSYNAGEMRSFVAEAIETTGFNQWNEEWKNGHYSTTNGNFAKETTRICSADHIRILPSTEYFCTSPAATWALFYTSKKEFITGSYMQINGRKFTTPAAAHYLTFYVQPEYGATYKNDICINISHSGYRDGEYDKYEKFVRTLPVARYFPEGMRSAGNVRDELTAHEATTRVGVRAYAAGDENDSAVTTDGTKSCYALPEPMVVRIDEPLNLDYEVCDFGTEKIIGNNVPVKADIVYGFNAVDVIRNNSLNIDELTGALESTFADTLTGCVKKLKKAFDFSNIAVMAAPPTAAPASDGLYIDAINLKLYIAAGGMWFTMNLSEYQI